jgi:hypothetical protein
LSIEEAKSCTTVTQQINHKVTTKVFHTIKTKNNLSFTKSNDGREMDLNWNSQNRRRKHVNGRQYQTSKIQHDEYIPNNGVNHFNEKNLFYENDNVYKKPKEPEKVKYIIYIYIYMLYYVFFNKLLLLLFFLSYILRLLSQRENMPCFIQLMVHYIIFKCNLKIDLKRDMSGVFSGINQAMVIGIN